MIVIEIKEAPVACLLHGMRVCREGYSFCPTGIFNETPHWYGIHVVHEWNKFHG